MQYFYYFESYENIRNTKFPILTYPGKKKKKLLCAMHAYFFSSYCDPERDDKHLQIILKLFLQHVIENKTLPCKNI